MYKVLSNRPLDPVTVATLRALQEVGVRHGAGHFVIGATARDILMTHVYGIDAGRATRDVDFAIALEDWHQFELIKNALTLSGDFLPAAGQAHRLYYRHDVHGSAYPLDLIPFGAIERAGNVIAWPPDMQVVMNVAGYAEALETAIEVDIGEGVITNVISIPALAALKILAWNDRGLLDSKDAQDFYFLLRNYHRAGNEARLYEEAYAVLESTQYDMDLAGAALLGYDTKLILKESTRLAVLQLLDDPAKRDRLVIHMDRSRGANSAVTLRFIEEFEHGLKLPGL